MNSHWDESFDEPTIIADMTLDADPPDGYDQLPGPSVHEGDVLAHRYQLETRLSRRGAVQTWKAFDQKLPRSVMVHVVAPHDPRSSGVLDAARHAAVATDSRFLRVLDAVGGEDPDQPSLLVCEFAPGESLTDLLAAGPLSALEAAWIVREIADALAPMHERGLFHRRLSPDSVVITSTGNVKILGFLIEAALHPDHDDARAVWSEREAGDVSGLGRLLYACLLSLWPLDPDRPQSPRYGLDPAPLEGGVWLTPRQVRSSVSPALDAICDRILTPDPRQPGGRLTSASQVAQALSRVLGTADAAADLEQRIRFPVVPVRMSTRAAEQAGRAAVGEPDPEPPLYRETASESTAQWNPPEGFTAIAPPPAQPRGTRGITATHVVDDPRARGARPASPVTPSARVALDGGRQVDFRRRRLVFVLVVLVLISVVIGLGGVWLGSRQPGAPTAASTSSSPSASPSGTVPYTIADLHDFDPSADGGNNQENPNELGRAVDGNPSTAWHTLTYLNNPRLGGLKPGVGIVLNLGKPEAIGSVKLTLQGKPTAVEILVPKGTVTQAPMSTVKDWTVVAKNPAADTEVTLTPSSSVTSQWVLVYLTSLPKIATGKYRGGIAEVSVLP